MNAYNLHDFQLTGAPSWARTVPYDITATVPEGESSEPMARRQRLQSLLEDRFALKFHIISKDLPVYALVGGKSGPKLQLPVNKIGGTTTRNGQFQADDISMENFAANLSGIIGHIVEDKTGLSGTYRIDLKWTPENQAGLVVESGLPKDHEGASLFTALQEELGLKLERRKGEVPVYVIDRVDRPSAN